MAIGLRARKIVSSLTETNVLFFLPCLRFWAAHARKCGRKEQRVGEQGGQVECSGESFLTENLHVVFVLNCNSTKC